MCNCSFLAIWWQKLAMHWHVELETFEKEKKKPHSTSELTWFHFISYELFIGRKYYWLRCAILLYLFISEFGETPSLLEHTLYVSHSLCICARTVVTVRQSDTRTVLCSTVCCQIAYHILTFQLVICWNLLTSPPASSSSTRAHCFCRGEFMHQRQRKQRLLRANDDNGGFYYVSILECHNLTMKMPCEFSFPVKNIDLFGF